MEQTVKVWDPVIRLFHWSLAVSFAVAWLTADEWDNLHEWAGYAVAALIGFRLVWGLIGPRYARFSQFVRSPGDVAAYVGATLKGKEPRYLGHNPAGSLMILGLILAIAGTAATGWMSTLDAFWGAEWVEETHEALANLMLFMVVAHVAGVIFASMRHKENLVRSMISGHKRAPESTDVA
ncbi:MAG: cytochrome b/b6 domain-containing protein [Rhodospirillales bacterium]|nr:cytochrome b/b6 domain-containing protein [Rhodospirillales bacterium]